MTIMSIKVLHITVEISDQYGTSETKFIGVFDNDEKLDIATKHQQEKYKNKRTAINISEVLLNVSYDR